MPHSLLVLSVDGMCITDIPFVATLPAFGRLLDSGSYASARSILPALTYPNHVSQITGRTVSGHGVYGNTKLEAGTLPTDWFWHAADLDCPTIFDLAKAEGLRTASFFWPGTADADIDVLVPVIWDPENWSDPRVTFGPVSSPEAFPALFDKHVDKLHWKPKPDYDDFAIALTADVIVEQSADVIFCHVLAVDKTRHRTGVSSEEVREALIGVAHGLGQLLAQAGLISLDETGEVTSWDAWVHPAGLTGQVHIRPGAGPDVAAREWSVLDSWVTDPGVPIAAVHSAESVEAEHGFVGPFAAILEGADGTVIQPRWTGAAVVSRFEETYPGPASAHGGFPETGIAPALIAAGPDITPGMRLDGVSVVDQAATFAALLGLEIPGADGVAAWGMLRTDQLTPTAAQTSRATAPVG